MQQIPEELVQTLMRMTGGSREYVMDMLGRSMREMSKPHRASSETGHSGKKSSYTRTSYPHFIECEGVLKYTLRITLKRSKPAIWRKIEVPSNISLRHLGDLTLDLMGWDGGHLNQFRKGNDCYLPYYQREAAGEDDFIWECNNLNQEEFSIADLLTKKAQTVIFEYDFGDSWEHEIRLSSIDTYNDGEKREIVFLNGKRDCPPEDCGGIWGYEELLEILDKRKSGKRLTSDEKEQLEWAGWGKSYDPEHLDVEYCRDIAERYND